ncbi:MAG: serine/threonine-protein kinase [Planctomycetales bacterium]
MPPTSDGSEAFEARPQGLPVPRDADHLRGREPLEVLVTRFTEAVRRGERPSIEDYARRYHEWAEQIHELFPLIESLEHWKGEKEVQCLRQNLPEEFPVRRVGDYEFDRELGRGGMGIVFEAVQRTTGERFAVKLLPWRYATDMDQWRERFQREAATIARLQHPNIVRVYSFGSHEGYSYYVMQLVQGISLDRIVRKLRESEEPVVLDELLRAGGGSGGQVLDPSGRGSAAPCVLRGDAWRELASIGRQVALALAHAHENGVLHNDIKPANLLLQTNGETIVTDFGIGRRHDEEIRQDETQQTGTLRYMAPERILGKGEVRSDVYSLGATLYELLTRTPAFEAKERRDLIERIVQSQLRTPRDVLPSIPRDLETIVLNAMARQPGDRYASCAAMADDLSRFLQGQAVRSTRPSRWGEALRRLSRFHQKPRKTPPFR